jgi:hypothetical protein
MSTPALIWSALIKPEKGQKLFPAEDLVLQTMRCTVSVHFSPAQGIQQNWVENGTGILIQGIAQPVFLRKQQHLEYITDGEETRPLDGTWNPLRNSV